MPQAHTQSPPFAVGQTRGGVPKPLAAIALFTTSAVAAKSVAALALLGITHSLPAGFAVLLSASAVAAFSALLSALAFSYCFPPAVAEKRRQWLTFYGAILFGVGAFFGELLLANIIGSLYPDLAFGVKLLAGASCLAIVTVPAGLWLLWVLENAGRPGTEVTPSRQSGLLTATAATLLLMALLVSSHEFASWHHYASQKDFAKTINLAGRQRTLSQKIGRFALVLQNSTKPFEDRSLANLEAEVSSMVTQKRLLDALISEAWATWDDNKETARNAFEAANSARNALLASANAITASIGETGPGTEGLNEKFTELQTAVDAFLPEMEKAVAAFEHHASFVSSESQRAISFSLFALPAFLTVIGLAIILPIIHIIREQQRAQAAERLKTLRALSTLKAYRSALEKHFFVSITNADAEIVYANDRFCGFCDLPPDDVVGRTHAVLDPSLLDKTLHSEMRSALRSGETWRGDICIHKKDGKRHWIDVVAFAIRGEDGQPQLVFLHTDVTARKNAEENIAQANATLQAFVKHAPVGIAMLDKTMTYVAHTETWAREFRAEEKSLVGKNHYDVFPLTPHRRRDVHRRCLEGEVICIEEEQIELMDGSVHLHRWQGRPWLQADGRIGGILIHTENIAERKAAEKALRESEERFRTLFHIVPVAVVLAEQDTGKMLLASEDFLKITGYSAEELRTMPSDSVVSPDCADANALQRRLLKEEGRFGPIEKIYVRKDGTRVSVLVNGVAVKDSDNRDAYLAVAQDITQQRSGEERLWRLANIDSLTGLPNRMLFHERLTSALSTAKRNETVVAVGLLDLDNFKEVNDSFGHDAGDELLKSVAQRLSSAVRETDTVARLGGDEFALILPNVDSLADVLAPVESMFEAMSAPVPIGNTLRRCTLSMGLTVFPHDASSPPDLIKNADIALYRAKALGRNRMEIFVTEMRAAIEKRQAVRQEFEEALRAGNLSLFYQPVVSLTENRIVGCEALLRMRHPSGNLLTPDSFAEVFKDPGLAAPIGQCVLDLALDQIARWQEEGVQFCKVAINVTSADFRTGRFPEELGAQLSWYGIDPSKIAIEVTESMFLGRGAETVGKALKGLKAMGIEIVLDDFGTGSASLSDLKKFPIDCLKIDRTFIANMERDESDASIVQAVIQLGHSLGMNVTAEGVENEAQLKRLRRLQCDRIQGFLVARPMPPARLPRYLKQASASPLDVRPGRRSRQIFPM